MTSLVDEVIRLTNEKYAPMTPFEFAALKQTLCRFFSDKRVKVSLFLTDGMQKQDGTITLSCAGSLPPGVEMPGKILYYDVSGLNLGTDSFSFPAADALIDDRMGPPIAPRRQLACALGQNLYSKEKAATPPAAAAAAAAAAAGSQGGAYSSAPRRPQIDSAAHAAAILNNSESHARQDLNMLADLIGPASTGEFKLNLFPETSMPGGGGGGGGGTQMIVIDVGGRQMQASNRDLMGVMDDMNLGVGPQDGDDPDDLLSMMDNAGR